MSIGELFGAWALVTLVGGVSLFALYLLVVFAIETYHAIRASYDDGANLRREEARTSNLKRMLQTEEQQHRELQYKHKRLETKFFRLLRYCEKHDIDLSEIRND